MSPAPARKSWPERLFSMEGLLVLAGASLLLLGLATGRAVAAFWGIMILAGQVALHFVRKKDWQAHWAELERQQKKNQEQHHQDSDQPQ